MIIHSHLQSYQYSAQASVATWQDLRAQQSSSGRVSKSHFLNQSLICPMNSSFSNSSCSSGDSDIFQMSMSSCLRDSSRPSFWTMGKMAAPARKSMLCRIVVMVSRQRGCCFPNAMPNLNSPSMNSYFSSMSSPMIEMFCSCFSLWVRLRAILRYRNTLRQMSRHVSSTSSGFLLPSFINSIYLRASLMIIPNSWLKSLTIPGSTLQKMTSSRYSAVSFRIMRYSSNNSGQSSIQPDTTTMLLSMPVMYFPQAGTVRSSRKKFTWLPRSKVRKMRYSCSRISSHSSLSACSMTAAQHGISSPIRWQLWYEFFTPDSLCPLFSMKLSCSSMMAFKISMFPQALLKNSFIMQLTGRFFPRVVKKYRQIVAVSMASHMPAKSQRVFHRSSTKLFLRLPTSSLMFLRQSSRMSSKLMLAMILNRFFLNLSISPEKLLALRRWQRERTLWAMVVCLKFQRLEPHLNLSRRVESTSKVQVTRARSPLTRLLAISPNPKVRNPSYVISGRAICRNLKILELILSASLSQLKLLRHSLTSFSTKKRMAVSMISMGRLQERYFQTHSRARQRMRPNLGKQTSGWASYRMLRSKKELSHSSDSRKQMLEIELTSLPSSTFTIVASKQTNVPFRSTEHRLRTRLKKEKEVFFRSSQLFCLFPSPIRQLHSLRSRKLVRNAAMMSDPQSLNFCISSLSWGATASSTILLARSRDSLSRELSKLRGVCWMILRKRPLSRLIQMWNYWSNWRTWQSSMLMRNFELDSIRLRVDSSVRELSRSRRIIPCSMDWMKFFLASVLVQNSLVSIIFWMHSRVIARKGEVESSTMSFSITKNMESMNSLLMTFLVTWSGKHTRQFSMGDSDSNSEQVMLQLKQITSFSRLNTRVVNLSSPG